MVSLFKLGPLDPNCEMRVGCVRVIARVVNNVRDFAFSRAVQVRALPWVVLVGLPRWDLRKPSPTTLFADESQAVVYGAPQTVLAQCADMLLRSTHTDIDGKFAGRFQALLEGGSSHVE